MSWDRGRSDTLLDKVAALSLAQSEFLLEIQGVQYLKGEKEVQAAYQETIHQSGFYSNMGDEVMMIDDYVNSGWHGWLFLVPKHSMRWLIGIEWDFSRWLLGFQFNPRNKFFAISLLCFKFYHSRW